MGKRAATTQITKDAPDSNEPGIKSSTKEDNASVYQPNSQPRKISLPSKKFSFNSRAHQEESNKAIVEGRGDIKGDENELYLLHLKGLNRSLVDALNAKLVSVPSVNLQPLFHQYTKHVQEIKEKYSGAGGSAGEGKERPLVAVAVNDAKEQSSSSGFAQSSQAPFSFGTSTAPTTKFSFGSSTAQSEQTTKSSFTFGMAPTPFKSAASASTAPTSAPFSFTTTATEKPATLAEEKAPESKETSIDNKKANESGFKFSFGTQMSSFAPAAKQHSSPSTPPQHKMEEEAEEEDLDPESFQQQRTNDHLIARGEGEEDEECILEETCKLYTLLPSSGEGGEDAKQNTSATSWSSLGLIIFKLNKSSHADTVKTRMIARMQGSGKILINAWLSSVRAEAIEGKRDINLLVVEGGEGVKRNFLLRCKNVEIAQKVSTEINNK